ncbi:thiamine pyrophosphate-dependent enzyme, partial [Micromonospora saelicesensis]|uniref:thiamine pyrophosphate-dependent enzyme n=1 Tax=Micromonospora saelicesensis TaxID=285676 RepID=UPI0021AC0BAA
MLSDVTTPQDLDDRFRETLAALPAAERRRDPADPVTDDAPLTGAQVLDLFDAQVTSRQLDLAGRWLRSFGEGFYTIGSAGHEGNAAVAAALRPTDPALLHYRSGAFYCLRAAQVAADPTLATDSEPSAVPARTAEPDQDDDRARSADPDQDADRARSADSESTVDSAATRDPEPTSDPQVSESEPAGTEPTSATGAANGFAAYADAARDVLRGMVASSLEPIAGGRHKVFGRADLAIVPTTSTIASHLPRAVGMGLAVERLRRLDSAGRRTGAGVRVGSGAGATHAPWPPDAIVVCSFGDASVNHASATAAFNTAGWYDHAGLRIPVLFVCEDNGLGISVRSPEGWVETTLRAKPGIRYFSADGADPVRTYEVAAEAAAWVRRNRRPAVLHLRTVRLMGHAGADAESAYRSPAELAEDLDRDPVAATARLLVDAGVATGEELLARYDETGWQVRRLAEEVLGEPKLVSAADVVSALAPRRPVRVA